MKKWIQNLLGITKLIEEKKKQRELLENIHREVKRNADLTADRNKHSNIPRRSF
jgi:heme exporter protein D